MNRKIRCHQYLAGRFHEGYGRNEISKAEKDGRLKQTIDYDTMNLEGRNSYVQDSYCAYELVPTHADWKMPGVFCVTNNPENGSRAARTYGMIPETGDIAEAFSLLYRRPQMSWEDFNEYDLGNRQLTWWEQECSLSELKPGKYQLSEKAEQKMGQFLAAYWDLLSARMEDPDNEDKIALCIQVINEASGDSVETFRHQVSFFADEIVGRLPKAVRSMCSVSFGVPWPKRNTHKGVVCCVQSDDKDLKLNPLYSFVLDAVTRKVDVGGNCKVPDPDKTEQGIADILIRGQSACPEVYRRLEKHYQDDYVILKSYEVFAKIVEVEQRRTIWDALDHSARVKKVDNYSQQFKKDFDILNKTLTRNCKCAQSEAFFILLPVLQDLLAVMEDIEPGTELQTVFHSADISFFAACRKQIETVKDKESIAENKEIIEENIKKLDDLLTRNYQVWSEQEFSSSFLKEKGDSPEPFPQNIFQPLTRNALNEKWADLDRVLPKLREYVQKNYKLNYSDESTQSFVNAVFENTELSDESMETWETWLRTCSKTDLRSDIEPFASILLQWIERNKESELGTRKIAGIRESMAQKEETDDKLSGKADQMLVDRFLIWSKTAFASELSNKPIRKELFYPIALNWLGEINRTVEEQKNPQVDAAIDAVQHYCQEYSQEDQVCKVAEGIFSYLCKAQDREITRELYISQRDWLQEECRVNEKHAFVVLLILADKMFKDTDSMMKAGVDFVGEHMDDLVRYRKNQNYQTAVNTEMLVKRERGFLLANFALWRRIENEKDSIRYQDVEAIRDMAAEWQKDGLADSNLSLAELQSVYDSLAGIKGKDGRKLDLSILECHMIRVSLREMVAKAEKEGNIGETELHKIAEYRQKFLQTVGDEDDRDLEGAERILLNNLYLWSRSGFLTGEDMPDESFITLIRKWIESAGRQRKHTSKELKEISEALSEIPCITRAREEKLLEDVSELVYQAMLTEAKDVVFVDGHEDWLDRLVSLYTDEENEEASDHRRRIVKILAEASERGNKKARNHILTILVSCQNMIPEEALKLSQWSAVRKEQINKTLEKMLGRYKSVPDLAEENLSTVWNSEYSTDCSAAWEDLPQQADFDRVVGEYLDRMCTEAGPDGAREILEKMWELTADHGSTAKGITGIERDYAVSYFDHNYDEMWQNGNAETRRKLDALYDAMTKSGELLTIATHSDARKARIFIETYSKENLQENEIRMALKQVLEQPQWLRLLRFSEMETHDGAIDKARKDRDISGEGIGLRLIHDAAANPSDDGSYWNTLLQDILPGNDGVRQLQKMNPWTMENGRVLNAIAYLGRSLSDLGDGGEQAAIHLKRWLTAEAPDFMKKLSDSQTADKLWSRWEELMPASKALKSIMKPE